MFSRVTLEVSLKPFAREREEVTPRVAHDILFSWYPLLKHRKEISVMLWTSDGSELLEYRGRAEDTFEYARYLGLANEEETHSKADRDEHFSLYLCRSPYIEKPRSMTYASLAKIVGALRDAVAKLYPDARFLVGTTFDIGPEFAVSDFKYHRHPEIMTGGKILHFGSLDSTATLAADSRAYAAFPSGIPEGTSFAYFLGRQTEVFCRDLGFDYLWLSNGVGFSADPWSLDGKLYDGERFHIENLNHTREKVLAFWSEFRRGCPKLEIATRGTNNSAGIDYATDGVPLYEIYRTEENLLPPPNSPWAAINKNFGLELMGHMTRIAELPPEENFLFRYYIHDPWWVNSPWRDRYNREPHDIYLPMAISRINKAGGVDTAQLLSLLSIDNSYGEMPDDCVNEPIPHLLCAEREGADAVSPIVWVYPVREITTAGTVEELRRAYFGDRMISDAVNAAFPLNCVVSTDNFLSHDLALYRGRILLSPVPKRPEVRERLFAFAEAGGKVLLYGERDEGEGLPASVVFVTICEGVPALHRALAAFGYEIRVSHEETGKKPVLTLSPYQNSLLLSVYNPDTTKDISFRFPHGAPVLLDTETELREGRSVYRFPRSAHRECRVYVLQAEGVLSLTNVAPVSAIYQSKWHLTGLSDAEVTVFPPCERPDGLCVSRREEIGERFPTADFFLDGWQYCYDTDGRGYFKASHVDGELYFWFR